MALDELKARARERLQALEASPHDGVETFQRDALAFFARVPEPPLYRRRDDPARRQAEALLPEAEALLARSWRLGAAVQAFSVAIEAHAAALDAVAAGRVEHAETAWQDALVHERAATVALRLWKRSDEGPRPIYDAESGTSRYDPRPEASVEATLVCPRCRKVNRFQLSSRVASHVIGCPACKQPFTAYVGELRALELEPLGKHRRRYRFRVDDLSGLSTRIEFEDATPGELAAARRDLLAFLYVGDELRGVLNLQSSKLLWITSRGPCFVATVAFGEGSAELEALRRFRDRVLRPRPAGRVFIGWYYRHGPALAGQVLQRPALRKVVRQGLRAVIPLLERM